MHASHVNGVSSPLHVVVVDVVVVVVVAPCVHEEELIRSLCVRGLFGLVWFVRSLSLHMLIVVHRSSFVVVCSLLSCPLSLFVGRCSVKECMGMSILLVISVVSYLKAAKGDDR